MKLAAFCLWSLIATSAIPPCAARADDDPQVAAQIQMLGDPTPAKRDAAAEALLAMGRAAEPALERATNSDDPEIAERGACHSGTPPIWTIACESAAAREIAGTVSHRKRCATPGALGQIAGQNVPGIRVLAGLLHGASNATDRDLILKVMEARPHEAAQMLIINGDRDAAEQILTAASETGGASAARDLAAFEIFSGGLAAKIEEIKARLAKKDVPGDSALLAYLQRGAADLPAARAAAEKSGNAQLVDDILIEQQEWVELARRLAARTDLSSAPLEATGYVAYSQHLAGDMLALGRTIRAIDAFVDSHHNPATARAAARTLCLCGDVDTATDLLVRGSEFDLAAGIFLRRMNLREAMMVVRRGGNAPPQEQVRLRLRAMEIATYEGNKDLAVSNFTDAVRRATVINDAECWGLIARQRPRWRGSGTRR